MIATTTKSIHSGGIHVNVIIIIIIIIIIIKSTHPQCPHPIRAAQQPLHARTGHSPVDADLCERCHGDSAVPLCSRPQGQESRSRCSGGQQTHQTRAAPLWGPRVHSEVVWLMLLPAVLQVQQRERNQHTTGRGVAPSQSAGTPESAYFHCNTERTCAAIHGPLEFYCCLFQVEN